MAISTLFSDPPLFIIWVIAVVYGITVHEFAHVAAAYLMGDDTGKHLGRLTLNPVAHVDPVGLLMLMFAGFGWGKPAPFNPYNLKYRHWGPALVALAGPLANIISIIVFGLLLKYLRLTGVLDLGSLVGQLLLFLVFINFALIIFNLIPIPPLDGSRVLFAVLPHQFDNAKYWLAKNGPMVLIGLVVVDSFFLQGAIFGRLFSTAFAAVGFLF